MKTKNQTKLSEHDTPTIKATSTTKENVCTGIPCSIKNSKGIKIPIKVIISEYLKVSDFFIQDSQKSFLNAILDKVSKVARV